MIFAPADLLDLVRREIPLGAGFAVAKHGRIGRGNQCDPFQNLALRNAGGAHSYLNPVEHGAFFYHSCRRTIPWTRHDIILIAATIVGTVAQVLPVLLLIRVLNVRGDGKGGRQNYMERVAATKAALGYFEKSHGIRPGDTVSH